MEGGVPRRVANIGIHVTGSVVVGKIRCEAQACALTMGVIFALNLPYPKELRNFFEFIQKVVFQIESGALSPKVLTLKTKLRA